MENNLVNEFFYMLSKGKFSLNTSYSVEEIYNFCCKLNRSLQLCQKKWEWGRRTESYGLIICTVAISLIRHTRKLSSVENYFFSQVSSVRQADKSSFGWKNLTCKAFSKDKKLWSQTYVSLLYGIRTSVLSFTSEELKRFFCELELFLEDMKNNYSLPVSRNSPNCHDPSKMIEWPQNDVRHLPW